MNSNFFLNLVYNYHSLVPMVAHHELQSSKSHDSSDDDAAALLFSAPSRLCDIPDTAATPMS